MHNPINIHSEVCGALGLDRDGLLDYSTIYKSL
mgnify:FL=1